ncbi:MAG TPA: endonuclease III domain-containing protein [Syntrophorhabdaceae bacterium]|nr:endonuclease III domain-containing protein [Syntrophorhabdaceae bacterium]HQM82336.1 endonuclease III domain-containing protein [Syntrophorhabdaceae bacterium]
MNTQQRLNNIFRILLEAFGPRKWWPGETQLEVIVGAMLTQNTSWKNVERAIRNLKAKKLLDIKRLYYAAPALLSDVIRPAGYFNIKARRLKNVVAVLYEHYSGDIERLASLGVSELRNILLAINGIGPETADSIMLYAFDKPVFVVDAYTKRFLKNHRLYNGESYEDVQAYFMKNLPADVYLYNEFHALIVLLCQRYCKKTPMCHECPLRNS